MNTVRPRSSGLRRLRLGVTVLVLALAGMIVGAGTASAHAVLLSTTPANGQVLATSPTVVSMRFSESVDLGLAQVRLIGPDGTDVAGLPAAAPAPSENRVVQLTIPDPLSNGTYVVAWRVISADTHPVQGAFTFSVGQPSSTAPPVASSGGDGAVNVLYDVSRWTAYLGLAVLAGSAFFVAFCWPAGVRRRAVHRLFWGGFTVLAGSTLLALLLYGPYADGRSLAAIADPSVLGLSLVSRFGLILLARIVLLAAIATAAVWFLRRSDVDDPGPRTRCWRAGAVLGASALLAVTWSLATHSASDSEGVLALPADMVHLVSMSVWIGGLVALVVLLRSGDVSAMRAAVPRFSRTAGICVALLVVTGVYQAWRQVGTPSALFGTTYGVLLTGKLGAVIVLVGFGALARRWTRRHYGFAVVSVSDKRRAKRGPGDAEIRRFRRMVAAEAVLATALLGLTTVLVGTEPARAQVASQAANLAAAAVPANTGPPVVTVPFDAGGGLTGRGQVSVEFTPATVGVNQVHLQVLDLSGNPWVVPEVRSSFSLPSRSLGPIPVPLLPAGGDGHYTSGNLTLPFAGQWVYALTIRTSDVDETTLRLPVAVS